MTESDLNSVTIQLASSCIQIDPVYLRTRRMLEPYQAVGTPDICISVSKEDIESEYLRCLNKENNEPSSREAEQCFLLRKVADAMADRNTLLIHGAAIAIGNEAYLFTAPSGTGKTTHIRQWLEKCQDCYVVNGDKPFVKVDPVPMICGSPWNGKENYGSNVTVPLKAIIWMERSENNIIQRISAVQAFPYLLRQTYRPDDPERLQNVLQLLKQLSSHVSFYRFKFNNFKDDAFSVAYEGLTSHESEIK